MHGGDGDLGLQAADWIERSGGGEWNLCAGERVSSGCHPDSDDADCAGWGAGESVLGVERAVIARTSGGAVESAAGVAREVTVGEIADRARRGDAGFAGGRVGDSSNGASRLIHLT